MNQVAVKTATQATGHDRMPCPDRSKRPRRADRQGQSRSHGHQDAQVQDRRGRPLPPSQFHPQPCRLTWSMSRRDCSAMTPRQILRRLRLPRWAPASPSASTPMRSQAASPFTSSKSSSKAISISPGLGHRRSVGQAGRLYRRPRQSELRSRSPARRAAGTGRPRAQLVAGGQHVLTAGQSRRRIGLTDGRNAPSACSHSSGAARCWI